MGVFVHIGLALIFPILGIALLYFCRTVLKIEVKSDGAFILAIIATPLVGYLVFSGQLSEFKGIGIEAKFRDIAIQNVKIKIAKEDVKEVIGVTGKQYGDNTTYFGGGSSIVEIKIEKRGNSESDLMRYAYNCAAEIAANIQQGVFQGVIVTDASKVVGAIPQSYFLDLLAIGCIHTSASRSSECQQLFRRNASIPDLTQQQLKRTYLWDILERPKDRSVDYGSRVRYWHGRTITYSKAFELFSNPDVDFIVITDSEDSYEGIVTRERINSSVFSIFSRTRWVGDYQ
jgi:hypothetical protein